ncbi:MAG: FKBP-type peptidyl-prolyl cis-trans isomerase [Muribaculaceae bacterium]|nr:FKBP-type peptidyl-prolyl cis-trans isomerase [Muribaculaceae bacterium]
MKIRHIIFSALAAVMASGALSSCLGNDDPTFDYASWISRNEAYVTSKADSVGPDGKKVFEKLVPSWAPGVFILAQWHNDRELTKNNLVPMDNSTVDVIYECKYVDGTVLDSSYKNTTYGDSVYRCKPNANIAGFWAMLTSMHVGDSVTCVIPMNAAYGASTSNSVLPYSTLIYNMKLKRIHAYEVDSK